MDGFLSARNRVDEGVLKQPEQTGFVCCTLAIYHASAIDSVSGLGDRGERPIGQGGFAGRGPLQLGQG